MLTLLFFMSEEKKLLQLFQGDQKQIIINSFEINRKADSSMCTSRALALPPFSFKKDFFSMPKKSTGKSHSQYIVK